MFSFITPSHAQKTEEGDEAEGALQEEQSSEEESEGDEEEDDELRNPLQALAGRIDRARYK